MTDYTARARALFLEGHSCAQSVFGAFAPNLGVDFETAMRLTAGLGAGIGRLRETCGAVLGMAMALSLARAEALSKEQLYAAEQELVNAFRQAQGSILCRDLLGEAGKDTNPTPAPRTAAYYAARPCEHLVACAAGLLEERLQAHPAAKPCEPGK